MNNTILFSQPKKHRLAVSNSEFYHELIRAYLHNGYERASDLVNQLIAAKILNQDLRNWHRRSLNVSTCVFARLTQLLQGDRYLVVLL
jgi:hypothetical protein